MRAADTTLAADLLTGLAEDERQNGLLRGIRPAGSRQVFVRQILDSRHRNSYFEMLRSRPLDPSAADPSSRAFDPVRASIIRWRAGEKNEAVWLAFLFVHFGRNRLAGWRHARDVYGRLGQGGLWDWDSVSDDVAGFREWLDDNRQELRDPARGRTGFGNHRKYQSLSGWSPNGTGATFETFVSWVGTFGGMSHVLDSVNGLTPAQGFDALYRSLATVRGFGRTARFDFLCTLMRLGYATIEPGHTYLVGASGPRDGAKLLIYGAKDAVATARSLQLRLEALAISLHVGADELEDAVCNWQKRPTSYFYFQG